MKIIQLLIVILIVLFVSCNDSGSSEDTAQQIDTVTTSQHFGGTFSGITPCADCPGINTVMNFFPDSNFIEHLKYLERPATFSDTGRWQVIDSMIVTTNNSGNKRYYRIISDSVIKILDGNGREIEGALNEKFLLKRTDTVIDK